MSLEASLANQLLKGIIVQFCYFHVLHCKIPFAIALGFACWFVFKISLTVLRIHFAKIAKYSYEILNLIICNCLGWFFYIQHQYLPGLARQYGYILLQFDIPASLFSVLCVSDSFELVYCGTWNRPSCWGSIGQWIHLIVDEKLHWS